ncbi:MAG: carboxypeptidase regulatory-like domain-containing protein [Bacteroidetes bacterium]|nr:carboxypeptidase regulatory-like domain-containing protein [Bacteroidota bacterium]
MKKHLEDKLNMALATEQVMNDNTLLWNAISAMVTAVTALGTKIAEIHGVRGIQEQDTRGPAIDKGEKKLDAIKAALPVIGGLKAFAKANKDNTLLKKIDYTRAEMKKVRDTILVDQLKIVRDEANNNIGSLPPYNVTSTEVNALSSAIAAYEIMIPKPRVALNIRKNATEALNRLFQEIDTPLGIMDGLMDTLEQTQPTFFETYKNARIIVDSSSGGSGVKGTAKDKLTGAPLEGVLITINAPLHRTRTNSRSATRTMTTTTNADGNYEIRRLRPGQYTLTMELDGYIKLSVQVTIEDGRIADTDGEMVRVANPSA